MKPFLIPLGCLLLPACSDTVISNGRVGGMWGDRDMSVTYTTADVRVISERPHPLDASRKVLCTEPSPDVAKALAAAAEASAKASVGADGGQLSGQASSSEAVLELAGRSTALLGLRDGLFRTCEAYANGAIGDDAYALVMSRYGQLMVTLFLAQDIQNAAPAGADTVSTPTLPSVGGGGTTPPPAQKPAPGAPAAPGAKEAATPAADVPAADLRALFHRTALEPAAAPAPVKAAKPVPKTTTTPPPAAAAPVDAPAAIAALGQGYFDLDKNELHLLITACINEFDETRVHATSRNEFLRLHLCPALENPALLAQLLVPQAAAPGKPAHR